MQICSLVRIPESLGLKRIMPGVGVAYPVGNPLMSEFDEMRLRKSLVKDALELLEKAI